MIEPWAEATKRLLRAEMTKRGVSYADLLTGLERIGIAGENDRSLRNKVARGTFSASFLIQCLLAMSVTELRIDPEMFEGLTRREPGKP